MLTPEWRELVDAQLREYPKATSYALATVSQDGKPRNRFVIHRSFSPSSMLLTTTDKRMAKPAQLAAHPHAEVAWWVDPSGVQFRIAGPAFVVEKHVEGSAPAAALQAKMAELGLAGDEADPAWWERERVKTFTEGMSGHLRASFARPAAPGTSLVEAPSKPEEWPETIPAKAEDKEAQEQLDFALSNFTLLAIKPVSFEYLELKVMPNRRTAWRLEGDQWTKVSVVP